MIRKKIKAIVRGKSRYKSILINSLINNNTDIKSQYQSNENFFFSFAHSEDILYSIDLYDSPTSFCEKVLCVIYLFDYMNDDSFIECVDRGSKEHYENVFKAKNDIDIIPKMIFMCCDYPFYSDEDDDKINFYTKILIKKKLSDSEQYAQSQLLFTNIKNKYVLKDKIKKLFINISQEKPKIVDEVHSPESEEEYEESESNTNSSSETAHESNHSRHKKTLLDKFLSLVTNCCGTREKITLTQ